MWLFPTTIPLYELLRPIPTRRLTTTPTGRWPVLVTRRSVGGEISNMLDISRRSPVARPFWSPGDRSPSCPINRAYPQGDRRHNQPSSADCAADYTKVAKWVWPFRASICLSVAQWPHFLDSHWSKRVV